MPVGRVRPGPRAPPVRSAQQAQHAVGPAGVSGYVVVSMNGTGTAEAVCPAGDHVLGGGGNVTNNGALTFSVPNAAGTSWTATAVNPGVAVVAYAICANVN